jgi:hypothetical protein
MNDDQTLCIQLLESVISFVPLQIRRSDIPGDGAGLFITNDVEYGDEVFRSDPVVSCVADGMLEIVCDLCYAYSDSKTTSDGRLRAEDDEKMVMTACSGCKVCYYCSKV